MGRTVQNRRMRRKAGILLARSRRGEGYCPTFGLGNGDGTHISPGCGAVSRCEQVSFSFLPELKESLTGSGSPATPFIPRKGQLSPALAGAETVS